MLKRTKGRLLLTLLVVTGLAGTLKDTTVSNKERKSAVSLMKNTRAEVLKSVKELSESQLNFKAATYRWSIKECIYHIAASEKKLWGILESSMKGAATPEKRSEIKMTDDDLIKLMEDRNSNVKTTEPFEPKKTNYKSIVEALNAFKNARANHIKYIKTTTEDLRNHIVQMPLGSIDCYQLCIMIALHNNRHIDQINELKNDPGFPKN